MSAAVRLRSLIPSLTSNRLPKKVSRGLQQTNKFAEFHIHGNNHGKFKPYGPEAKAEDPPCDIIAVGPISNIFVGIPYIMSAKSLGLSPKRATYFQYYRRERTAMKILENTHESNGSYAEYRSNRFLYYVVFQQLARFLWYGPDRDRLTTIGHDLFNQILSYRFKKSGSRCKPPKEVHIWDFCQTNQIM